MGFVGSGQLVLWGLWVGGRWDGGVAGAIGGGGGGVREGRLNGYAVLFERGG